MNKYTLIFFICLVCVSSVWAQKTTLTIQPPKDGRAYILATWMVDERDKNHHDFKTLKPGEIHILSSSSGFTVYLAITQPATFPIQYSYYKPKKANYYTMVPFSSKSDPKTVQKLCENSEFVGHKHFTNEFIRVLALSRIREVQSHTAGSYVEKKAPAIQVRVGEAKKIQIILEGKMMQLKSLSGR